MRDFWVSKRSLIIIISVLSVLLIRSSAWLLTMPILTNVGRIGMFVAAIIYGRLLLRDKKPVPMVVTVLLFYLLLGVSTLLGSRDIVSFLSFAFPGGSARALPPCSRALG